jgi:hypothetical protein
MQTGGVAVTLLSRRRDLAHLAYEPVLLGMSKKPPYARIAVTLPEEVLAAADQLAATQDRSRSWIVAEAIRRYAAAAPEIASPMSAASAVSRVGLGESRLVQLVRDMSLTPEQRVLAAEESLRLSAALSAEKPAGTATFDRYEDFLDWKQLRRAGR